MITDSTVLPRSLISRNNLRKIRRSLGVSTKILISINSRSFGDLSENSEYDAAKDEQGFIEQRILEMEQMIRYAVIIELDEKSSAIRLGNTVTYQELPNGATETYKIVGSAEANPFDYKISNESPVAQALLGKEVGDVAKVSLPTGPEDSMEIKILEVE